MEISVALGLSLGFGLLIGLQRERTESRLGGIRTFPLISIFGTFASLLATTYGAWVLAAAFLALAAVLGMAGFHRLKAPDGEAGLTTEIAALITFGIGAYLVQGDWKLAAVATGVVVVLLHLKEPMHRFVNAMGEKDMGAVMQFVVISLIVLPLLPNRTFGPYDVLNPFNIWRMVVLIVGIGVAGFIVYKIVGERAGDILGGVLGGMISSTATTVSYARRSKGASGAYFHTAFIIMIASTITYFRVLFEISAVAPKYVGELFPPLAVMALWMIGISVAVYFVNNSQVETLPQQSNPAHLRSALVFGALYAGILLAVGAARQHFGPGALYGVALVSGLTDMDAITLSISTLVEHQRVPSMTGWRLILAASLANLVFKGAIVAFLGDARLAWRVALLFAIAMAGGIVIILFWPEGWVVRQGAAAAAAAP